LHWSYGVNSLRLQRIPAPAAEAAPRVVEPRAPSRSTPRQPPVNCFTPSGASRRSVRPDGPSACPASGPHVRWGRRPSGHGSIPVNRALSVRASSCDYDTLEETYLFSSNRTLRLSSVFLLCKTDQGWLVFTGGNPRPNRADKDSPCPSFPLQTVWILALHAPGRTTLQGSGREWRAEESGSELRSRYALCEGWRLSPCRRSQRNRVVNYSAKTATLRLSSVFLLCKTAQGWLVFTGGNPRPNRADKDSPCPSLPCERFGYWCWMPRRGRHYKAVAGEWKAEEWGSELRSRYALCVGLALVAMPQIATKPRQDLPNALDCWGAPASCSWPRSGDFPAACRARSDAPGAVDRPQRCAKRATSQASSLRRLVPFCGKKPVEIAPDRRSNVPIVSPPRPASADTRRAG
jgi:hypothetical protein